VHLLMQIALVSVGSALGGLARWGIGVAFGRAVGIGFPWGTLFINLSGSLFLGWFSTAISDRFVSQEGGWLRADDLRLLVAVGFTGAYTTFSTYEYETHRLLDVGENLLGLTYLVGSMFFGLLAVRAGMLLARL
jgi:fluoride exporter